MGYVTRALVMDLRYRRQLVRDRSTRARLLPRGTLVLLTQRLARRCVNSTGRGRRAARMLDRLVIAVLRPLILVVAKSEITPASEIAPGVHVSDHGYVVLGADSIGSGTIIHHRVTLGLDSRATARPKLERNVWIGPDCVIFGDIRIGEGATVLPGSVVSKSVPPRTVVTGNPARIVARDFDNSPLRASATCESPQIAALCSLSQPC